MQCKLHMKVYKHFLVFLAIADHRISHLPQDGGLHLVLHHQGSLSGVHVQPAAPHPPDRQRDTLRGAHTSQHPTGGYPQKPRLVVMSRCDMLVNGLTCHHKTGLVNGASVCFDFISLSFTFSDTARLQTEFFPFSN